MVRKYNFIAFAPGSVVSCIESYKKMSLFDMSRAISKRRLILKDVTVTGEGTDHIIEGTILNFNVMKNSDWIILPFEEEAILLKLYPSHVTHVTLFGFTLYKTIPRGTYVLSIDSQKPCRITIKSNVIES